MTTAEHAAMVINGEHMAAPRLVPFAGGQAAVFSARAPDKDGPNEDAAGLFEVAGGRGVLVVADGLGGQPAGHSASAIALESVGAALDGTPADDGTLRGAILDALERANERVLALGVGAATTFAAVEIAEGGLRPYHVGDSDILVVGQRGKTKLQTFSHSPVGYAFQAGLLDESEAVHHDERHLVSNMVGASDMRIEVGSRLNLAPLDTVVIGTDGLFDNLVPSEVIDVVRVGPLKRAASELARRSLDRMVRPVAGHPSKPDDLTFVLYRSGRRG
jgi:protein phosphatase